MVKTQYDLLAFVAPQTKLPQAHESLLGKDLCLSVTAAAPFKTDGEAILEEVNLYRNILEQQGITIVRSRSDLKKPGLKIILNLQSPPSTIGFLPKLFEAGIRICQIGYYGSTHYGGGFMAPTVPLRENGKSLIREMKDLGMILDLAHAGTKTSFGALDLAGEINIPVMISHTGAYNVHCNMRNAVDEVLRRTAELKGIIGIYELTFGLSQTDNSEEAYLKHFRYMRGLADSICVGSDGWYCDEVDENGMETFKMLKAKLDPDDLMQARYPENILEWRTPEKMTKIYNLVWKETDATYADKFCSLTADSFFNRSLPE
jgi:microsomal dipeptidase-like Zn-dependent dipeptidase